MVSPSSVSTVMMVVSSLLQISSGNTNHFGTNLLNLKTPLSARYGDLFEDLADNTGAIIAFVLGRLGIKSEKGLRDYQKDVLLNEGA